MNIEPGIYLLKKEFAIKLNIPMNQIDRRKDELYEWLERFFDYELLDGKPARIKIIAQIGEYQPLPHKYNSANRTAEVETAKKDYEAYTIASLGIDYKPNSKSKIARDGIEDFGQVKYNHNNYEWVARKYIKEPFDKNAETNGRYVWVDYFCYEPLDEETLNRWHQILDEEQMDQEHRATAFDKMMQGEDISREKSYYQKALARFKKEFGFTPVHVREWKLKTDK